MNFKRCLLAVAGAALFAGGVANASIMEYDITVSSNWYDGAGNPFGMSLSPTLSGTIVVDNSQADLAAIDSFSITTGTQTWTMADFVDTVGTVNFDASGDLTDFSLVEFEANGGSMSIFSNNTMSIADAAGNFNFCNNCVSIGPGVPVPTPAPTALVGIGLLGLAASRYRKQS